MKKTPKYTCRECGAPITGPGSYCEHVRRLCPGFCRFDEPQFRSLVGHHDRCPGQAQGKPEGSCPCSCHPPLADVDPEELAAITDRLTEIQRELEEVNHAEM